MRGMWASWPLPECPSPPAWVATSGRAWTCSPSPRSWCPTSRDIGLLELVLGRNMRAGGCGEIVVRLKKKGRVGLVGVERGFQRQNPCSGPPPWENIGAHTQSVTRSNVMQTLNKKPKRTCTTVGYIPLVAFLTSTALAITTRVAWEILGWSGLKTHF